MLGTCTGGAVSTNVGRALLKVEGSEMLRWLLSLAVRPVRP